MRVFALARIVWCVIALPLDDASARQAGEGAFPDGPEELLSKERYPVRVTDEIMIAMRDGVGLATLVALPEGPGPWPAVLIRTPYGRRGDASAWAMKPIASRGYAFVSQDVRGKGDSEGEPRMWVGEAEDGVDTIAWIAEQPWCDGNVGMLGGSALGYAQWAAAALRPPALKSLCVFPAISDPFFGGAYDCGVFSLPPFAAYTAKDRVEGEVPAFDEGAFKTLPLHRLDDEMFGENVPTWEANLSRSRQTDWPTQHWPQAVEAVDIPVLMFMALWDGDGIGPILNWTTLRDDGHDERWLVFGPWAHGMDQIMRRGDVQYGARSRIRFLPIIVRWLDHTLGSRDSGQCRVPRARVFVTGLNQWRGWDDWPPRDARARALFLAPGEVGGVLSANAPAAPARLTYAYDPLTAERSFRESVFLDSTVFPLDDAGDQLVFLSEPFERPETIGGRIELDLRFSTTGTDTDFFAYLLDVDPSGAARVLTHPGKIRASFVDGFDRPRPLEPGKTYATTIRLWDIAHRFEPGHRLGLAIRSEWFPRWARNLNRFGPLATATATDARPATQSLHLGGPEPSRLRFQQLPDR